MSPGSGATKHFSSYHRLLSAASPDLRNGRLLMPQKLQKPKLGRLAATPGEGAVAGEGPTGSCIVARGEGTFELQHRVPAPGHPHVTFYDVRSGEPFGGRYFGNGPSLLLAKNWSSAH